MKDYKKELEPYTSDADPFWDFNHLYRARAYASGGSFISAMVSFGGSIRSYFKHFRVAGTETLFLFCLAFSALWHAFFPWIGGFHLVRLSTRHMTSVINFVPKHPEVVRFHLWSCERYKQLVEEERNNNETML